MQAIQSFGLQPASAAAHIGALAQLTQIQGVQDWPRQVLAAAEGVLGDAVGLVGTHGSQGGHMGQYNVSALQDKRTATALFTVGEVRIGALCFSDK